MKFDEIKLTAYALGELSEFEAKEIEQFISQNPTAKKFVNDTRALSFDLKAALKKESIPETEGFLQPSHASPTPPPRKFSYQSAAIIVLVIALAFIPIFKKLQNKQVAQLAMDETVQPDLEEVQNSSSKENTPKRAYAIKFVILKTLEVPEKFKALVFQEGHSTNMIASDLKRLDNSYCAIINLDKNKLYLEAQTIESVAIEENSDRARTNRFMLHKNKLYNFYCEAPEMEEFQFTEFLRVASKNLAGWVDLEGKDKGDGKDPMKLSLVE